MYSYCAHSRKEDRKTTKHRLLYDDIAKMIVFVSHSLYFYDEKDLFYDHWDKISAV